MEGDLMFSKIRFFKTSPGGRRTEVRRMVKRWRQRRSSFYRASRAMGRSICHADGAQTPSGHCAVSPLIHEGGGFTSSALGLLFNYLHIESGAIRWEHEEWTALSNSFMGRIEVSGECCLWCEAGCDKEFSPGFFSPLGEIPPLERFWRRGH